MSRDNPGTTQDIVPNLDTTELTINRTYVYSSNVVLRHAL